MIGMLLWTLLIYVTFAALCRRARAGQLREDDAWLLLDKLETCVCVSCFDSGEILYANRKAREEFGLKDEPGQLCWEMFREGEQGPCANCPKFTVALQDGSCHIWESYNTKIKKHYKNIEHIITWNGTKAYMQHFLDLTESKETEAALETALENARHMNDVKSEFLSRMSHEIRTPMNAVIGMAKIAKQSQDGPEVQSCLDSIEVSAKQLRAIINDIFDVSKIESRTLELVSASFNFKNTMSDVYEEFKKQADDKKQQLTFLLDNTINTMYIGDEARLSQVVSNLLSNAVKFTPENGRVVFSAKEKERAGGTATVEVSVTDSGIGISKENLVKLFSPFEQIDGGRSRKYGGTGLGLVLSKNIVELMDGEFDVKSELEKGSTFSFTAKFTIGNDIPGDILRLDDTAQKDAGGGLSGESAAVKETSSEEPVMEQPAAETKMDAEAAYLMDFDAMLPFINVKRGLENLKGNGKLYAVLLRSYQKNGLLAEIRELISVNNFKEALHNAQALKSTASIIGLDDLRVKIEALEESLRALKADDTLLSKLEITTGETRKLIPELIHALEKGKLS